jgi:hypothetical protein
MRYLGILFILILLGVSSCKKYKLNQPAYLSLNWSFSNNSEDLNEVVLTGGFFYLDQLSISGVRKEGPNVDVDQTLPIAQTQFSSSGSLGLSLDIPVGEYESFEVELSVNNNSVPSMVLFGTYDNGNEEIPVEIQWSIPKKLVFKASNGFTLNKKEDYSLTIGNDVNQLLSSVSASQWDLAAISNENGTPTLIIRENFNAAIYQDIEDRLLTSLKLSIK